MSTRAIVGVVQKDGTFLGAWQWSDGGTILDILNRKFNTDETVKELLSVGAWQIMLGPRQWKEYCDYTKKQYGWPEPQHIVVNNVYFKKESYCANKPTVYKNIIDAANEDINYVYVYDRENHKWKRYDSWKLIQGKYKL
jgi:hypothetical protein